MKKSTTKKLYGYDDESDEVLSAPEGFLASNPITAVGIHWKNDNAKSIYGKKAY